MRRIGLTGGIGSGKSTVAELLAERGAHIVDADLIAREVVAPGTPGLAELVDTFGPDILLPDGSLDRTGLAAIVFNDPHARGRLNAITHPRISARTAETIATLPDDAIMVHDMPLLVELDLARNYDAVVVVDAPEELRVRRLVERGLSDADARARIAAQASREARLAVADVVIDNSGSLESLTAQVRRAWPTLSGQP